MTDASTARFVALRHHAINLAIVLAAEAALCAAAWGVLLGHRWSGEPSGILNLVGPFPLFALGTLAAYRPLLRRWSGIRGWPRRLLLCIGAAWLTFNASLVAVAAVMLPLAAWRSGDLTVAVGGLPVFCVAIFVVSLLLFWTWLPIGALTYLVLLRTPAARR
jgi:hypothetical protein